MIAWMKRKTKAHKIHPFAMLLLLSAGTLPLTACITLAAPDKPIVIELNINIQQEVVYRLDGDAKNLIEENEDIF